MGTPLRETTFVVIDLETTGGAPGAHAITEIGAVRVRGGVVEKEFTTLVDPGAAIPAQITVLTGITNAMVVGAPPVGDALSSFLRWARLSDPSTVLVAHNARFDVGHLRSAARELTLAWEEPRVLDTLALARRAWRRPEVPDHRLGTLASFVGSATRPTHRALDDARATVDVLHAALEALAPLGVTHLEDLATATDPVPPRRRAKSPMADGLPTGPGVYQFLSPADQVLYVGSAVNLRRRVRSYFTAAERRTTIARMVDTTAGVRVIETATEIEARVRELRLIAELSPPANRRSKAPRRMPWIHLVSSPGPRLATTTVPSIDDALSVIGPFPSRSAAQEAIRAAESVLRLGARDGRGPTSVTRADSPVDGRIAMRALSGDADLVVRPVLERVEGLAARERYEEAGAWAAPRGGVRPGGAPPGGGGPPAGGRHEPAGAGTARRRACLRGGHRAERARPLLVCPHLIAARRRESGGWELVAVRWGRLAGSMTTPAGADPRPAVETLRATAQVVERPGRIGAGTSAEETLLLADWVLDAGARLVEVDATGGSGDGADVAESDVCAALSWPIGAAARYRRVMDSS